MIILWTEHALACLAGFEDFIVQDDPVAAVLLVENLIARTDILKDHPLSGRRVPEVPKSSLRELVEANYRIVYRVRVDSIEILTVFESHRLYRDFEG
jgi:plasmid stabilization system protein ParE